MKTNYFTLANNYRNNADELNEISTIYTMSTIKRLLGKTYTPYLDDLRRTYGQNKKAEQLPTIAELIAEELEERNELKAEVKAIKKDLEEITLPTADRQDLDQEYFETLREVETLNNDLATLRTVSTETYSDLKDLSQEFALAYISYFPTSVDYIKTINKILGLDTDTPSKHQKDNRKQWEQLTNRQKRGALEHIARIKAGQRAVNRYIRQQANQTADYNKKCISFEVITEDGEKQYTRTYNTYAESLEDLARIKAIAKSGHLTTRESRFLNLYCSKGARQAEQKARTQYYAEQYDKMTAKGDYKRFNERLNEKGYKARRDWTFTKIGIIKANRQSEFMKKLQNKLLPIYREVLAEVNK